MEGKSVTTDVNAIGDAIENIGHWLTVLYQLEKGLSIEKLKMKKGFREVQTPNEFH